jgi:prepilin-type N-terminal cleavage/methylation domain-containing protein
MRENKKRAIQQLAGFSLVELWVVMAVIALLAALLGAALSGSKGLARGKPVAGATLLLRSSRHLKDA